jgi:lipopolysaccharide export system protein LptA
MIIIVLNAFKVISKYKIDNYEIQDEISTIQIMRLLTISNNIDVSSNRISFDLDNKTWNIELINNNVILQPGTQFIFIDVDNAWFNKENRFIYINFIRKNIEYKRLIGYV